MVWGRDRSGCSGRCCRIMHGTVVIRFIPAAKTSSRFTGQAGVASRALVGSIAHRHDRIRPGKIIRRPPGQGLPHKALPDLSTTARR